MSGNYPKFLKNSPEGEDLFDGKSHDKVAIVIKNAIVNNSFENHVIGIEGEWGSGKSNTIEILKGKFKEDDKKPYFFTFDAWGHQEDLTRRSFLEELINELLEKEILLNNQDKWGKIEAELLAKKSTKHVNKFPLIKKYWIFITLSILSFALLSIIYEDFFQLKDNIKFINFYFGRLELFFIKYLFPTFLFLCGIKDLISEFRKLKKPEDVGLKENQKLTNWKKIEYLAYWFNGKDLTSKEVENIIDKEPSVRQFKKYFNKIVEDLNPKKVDQLILIFDNMDRLSTNQKLMSLWSSIHTFFAECTYKNVWILIPFDRTHLANFFNRDDRDKGQDVAKEFINKTFSTSFRISPPVVSDWKSFFNIKLVEAFGEGYFKSKKLETEKYYIESIFDYSFPSIINPRQVITYLNSIVSLLKQWDNQIPLRYLALFTIKKNSILNNPLESISKANYLGNLNSLFLEDTSLEKYMSALVFNVDLNKANEVLLKREMEQIFINTDLKKLKEIQSHSAFKSYFDKVFKDFTTSNTTILSNISVVLIDSKDIFGENVYYNYWKRINNELYREVFNKNMYHKEFDEIHKSSLINSKNPKGTPKKIIKKLIESVQELSTKNGRVNFEYYEFIKNIESFLNNNKIEIEIKDVLAYCVINPEHLKKIIEIELNNFNNYKIFSIEKELNEYLITNDYGLTNLKEEPKKTLLELVVEVLGHNKFKLLKNTVEEDIDDTGYSENEKLRKLIITQRILTENGNKPIENKLDFATVRDHFSSYHTTIESDYFPDIISLLISYQEDKSYSNTTFINVLNNEDEEYKVEDFSKVIEYYITYGDLLKLIVNDDDSYKLLNDIVKDLTKTSYGLSTLSVSWVFSSYNEIIENVFEDNPDTFLQKFDRWSSDFNKHIDSNNVFNKIEESFFYQISDEPKQAFKSVEFAYELAINNFENKTSDEWKKIFDSKSKVDKIFKHLYDNNKLPNKITKSNDFMLAYERHMNDIINGEVIEYDESFWKELVLRERINVNSLKRVFSNILDNLLHHDHNITKKELLFFKDGLIKYSTNLIKDASDVQRQILIPFLNDKKVINEFIIPNKEKIVEVINASDDFLHDIKDIIKSKLDNPETIAFEDFKYLSDGTKIHGLIEEDKKNSKVEKSKTDDENEKKNL